MILVDFMGGLHGNFFAYVLNSLDPEFDRSILPFTKSGTSHVPYKKTIAKAAHYSAFNLPVDDDDIVVSITVDESDCLLLNLLCFGRSGDYNFDLKNFQVDFYNQIKNTNFFNLVESIQQSYGYDVTQHKDIPRGILREYFKFGFKDSKINGLYILANQLKYLDRGPSFNFKKLYDFDCFIEIINLVGQRIDYRWLKFLHSKFVSNIKELNQVAQCKHILEAIKQQKNLPIDFNLLQESWLNAMIENLYEIEMPFHQEQYFNNTEEILQFIKS
jgi:hypothetical protein